MREEGDGHDDANAAKKIELHGWQDVPLAGSQTALLSATPLAAW
ncbi:hypothetical protein PF010_g3311 [Phytophthora fragariae]|uniref:Uncharacterized protein n=1 Tax=Phytophthora fragariae TaxID=53985 RepID=A0A6A4AB66_9STRA|nr:hypothetical protein PF003_g30957 [Phytophthora fragariae]KAE9132101.1 hypothetical protein PF010_g3311 [Phytophthora fragariae]KAE9253490.1 hypothetical protein PF002_g3301 [Phytophthora fragariae]